MQSGDAQMECKDEKKTDAPDSDAKDGEAVAVVRYAKLFRIFVPRDPQACGQAKGQRQRAKASWLC
jgi:hypothetical protein